MTNTQKYIYIAHSAPFKKVKKEVEAMLGFEVKIHENNNQVAYFEANKELDINEIEGKLADFDVIILSDEMLEEYI